jgi:Uma2 family endonuclease
VKITEVPLGIVEILSPSQSELELIEKLPFYFNLGIKSAWLVIPVFKMIYVFDAPKSYHTFTLADNRLKDSVLGIELDMTQIFK